jgi:predicted Fe-Mo cluster-binding NifX family protein
MKIAISSTGDKLESAVDERFGRCPYFFIAELENNEIKSSEAVENTSASQMGGAGMTAAQAVAEKKVDAVITGNIGPRAFSAFQQLGIEVYQGSGTVKEVLDKFAKNELKKINEATGPMRH